MFCFSKCIDNLQKPLRIRHVIKACGKKMAVERIRQKFDAAKSKHNIDFEVKEEQLKIAMAVMGG